mgnify:CR=1 FL=1
MYRLWRDGERPLVPGEERIVAVLPLFHVHGLGNGVHTWLALSYRARLLERFDALPDGHPDIDALDDKIYRLECLRDAYAAWLADPGATAVLRAGEVKLPLPAPTTSSETANTQTGSRAHLALAAVVASSLAGLAHAQSATGWGRNNFGQTTPPAGVSNIGSAPLVICAILCHFDKATTRGTLPQTFWCMFIARNLFNIFLLFSKKSVSKIPIYTIIIKLYF